MWTWPRRLARLAQQKHKAKRSSATTRISAMKDPTAMPMIVPIGSCVGAEGWSRFGERTAIPGELATEADELVAVVNEHCAWIPIVESYGTAVEVVSVWVWRSVILTML